MSGDGIGSGLAYAGGTTFLACRIAAPMPLPTPSVDDTVSYIARFQTLEPQPGCQQRSQRDTAFHLTPTLCATTPVVEPNGAGLWQRGPVGRRWSVPRLRGYRR